VSLKQKVEPKKVFEVFLPIFFLALILDQGAKFASVFLDFPLEKSQVLELGFLPEVFFYFGLFSLFCAFILFPKRSNLDYLSFALFLAGGASNLIDWVRLGYILDYFPFFTFFWFNLADLFIILAVCMLATRLFFRKEV
jgi:signal peptidase II